MNTQGNTRRFILNTPGAAVLDLTRKALAVALAYLMVPLGISDLYAQTAPPPPPDQGQYQGQAPPPPDQEGYDQGPPPQAYNALSPGQLDQLVAPIALYPDALVAQILAASTYPNEIADADSFVRSNPGVPPEQLGEMANGMNWDPSVKALCAFPSVLDNLNRNMDWTSQLGNAYYNQPQDVMNAIQDMRARAYAAGNLRTGPEMVVDYSPGDIIIAPANPAVYYVPWYNPWVVYGAPVVAWGGYYPPPRPVGYRVAVGIAIGFGIGIAIASWTHWGWGPHYWGMGWRNHTIVYQRNVYISRSVTVVNHGYYGRFDRNAAARRYNMQIARRAPNFHPVYNRGNNNFNRSRQFNRNQNFGRQQYNRQPAQNRSRQFNRTQNFNRTQQNREQFNRTQQYNRPQQNRERYNRQQARPQERERPQARPRQSRPENHGRPQRENNGHRR